MKGDIVKKVNMNDIAKKICDKEGKKKGVSIAQVKEILGVFADIMWNDPNVLVAFLSYAGRRKASSSRKG